MHIPVFQEIPVTLLGQILTKRVAIFNTLYMYKCIIIYK
jgi:hypothetical protein